jgi:hypothetical protein
VRAHRASLRSTLLGAAALLAFAAAPGCLVLSLNPVYDDDSIVWDAAFLGKWSDHDDNVSLEIEKGEWRSYKVHYEHPIETGDLTAYLTEIDGARYFDVMPSRGQDRGSFLVPVHAALRVEIKGDTLEVVPLSYDWFFGHVRSGKSMQPLALALDQKQNVLLTAQTPRIRAWLRHQPADGPMFGAPATFVRK